MTSSTRTNSKREFGTDESALVTLVTCGLEVAMILFVVWAYGYLTSGGWGLRGNRY
jgi:hypothetical protein